MMNSSVTDDRVFAPLRAFLLSIIPSGVEVIQTQDNLVPIPKGAFVSMNNIGVRRLSTNRHEYQSNQTKDIWTPVEYSMQVDFYGPDSGEWSFSAQTLFRDSYALDFFPEDIQPLHADDPMQIPLLNAESGYEQRWRMRCIMQTNVKITAPQQSATAANIDLHEVDHDITFPHFVD